MKLLIIVLMLCSLSSFVQNSTIEKIFLKFGEYGKFVEFSITILLSYRFEK